MLNGLFKTKNKLIINAFANYINQLLWSDLFVDIRGTSLGNQKNCSLTPIVLGAVAKGIIDEGGQGAVVVDTVQPVAQVIALDDVAYRL